MMAMKRFQFSLESILELRLEEEQEAEILLGKAVSEWNLLNEKKMSRMGMKASYRMPAGAAGQDLLQHGLYRARLDQEIGRLQKEMDAREGHLETLRERYREARAKREGLDKLKEKRKAEYEVVRKRAEAHQLDDLLNNMNRINE